MTSLKTRARLALEGSDRSDEAMADLCAYLDDQRHRVVWEVFQSNEDYGMELLVLLQHLHSAADPTGASPYRLQIVKRIDRPGPDPNPAKQRERAHDALFAATYADKLLRDAPTMQKKEANGIAAERFGVTVPEIYAARKDPFYLELKARRSKN